MPNHVINVIRSDKLEKIKKIVESDMQMFDFNKIIPTPDNIFQGNLGEAEEKQYGKENCWYDWNIKNWGTKWNAYDIMIEDDCIEFKTAWSTPALVIKALSLKIPDAEIRVEYADEDIGMNCGSYLCKNGEIISSAEGDEKFACDLWGYDHDEYLSDKEEN